MARLLHILPLIALLVFSAGCTQTAFSNPAEKPGAVNVALSKVDDEWSVGLGCYWTASGYVYNSGTQVAENVEAQVTLIDRTTGEIQDSRSIAIGRLSPGESRAFTIKLDGECGGAYQVEAQAV
jgi:hypothetical protein